MSNGIRGAIGNVSWYIKLLANLDDSSNPSPERKSVAIKPLGHADSLGRTGGQPNREESSDDGIAPAYAVHWVNELRSKLEKCSLCLNLEGLRAGLGVFASSSGLA